MGSERALDESTEESMDELPGKTEQLFKTVTETEVMPVAHSPFPASLFSDNESVAIAGPPMSGKYELLHRLLGEAGEDGAIVVSTGHIVDRVREDYGTFTDADPDGLSVIDCVSKEQDQSITDTRHDKFVNSPKNLTELGIKLTELIEDRRGESIAVGVHSLSQLLMYWEADRIYQFTRVFLGQTRNEGWFTAAVIGSTMHDERTLHTLLDPFDAIVDTRVDDDGRAFRIRDRTAGPGEWNAF